MFLGTNESIAAPSSASAMNIDSVDDVGAGELVHTQARALALGHGGPDRPLAIVVATAELGEDSGGGSERWQSGAGRAQRRRLGPSLSDGP